MEKGETLFYSILSEEGAFLGSAEMHGLSGDCPEIGVWIASSEQRKGYAYEALGRYSVSPCTKPRIKA